MENPPVNDQPRESQPLEQMDRGILRELGGPGGWRFWWPLLIWLLDALTVATFRPGATTEPSAVLLVASFVAVVLIWALGARPAILHGHNKMLVRMRAAVASLAVSAGSIAVGAVARVLEASIRGNDNASIFITTFGKSVDHTAFYGFAESTYLFFGLPILVILILVCWYFVGRGQPENQA